MQRHIRKVHAYLAVTCHLHFWQNDQGLLCATAESSPFWPWLCIQKHGQVAQQRSGAVILTQVKKILKRWRVGATLTGKGWRSSASCACCSHLCRSHRESGRGHPLLPPSGDAGRSSGLRSGARLWSCPARTPAGSQRNSVSKREPDRNKGLWLNPGKSLTQGWRTDPRALKSVLNWILKSCWLHRIP